MLMLVVTCFLVLSSPLSILPHTLLHSRKTNDFKPLQPAPTVRQTDSERSEANIAYFIQIANNTVWHLPRLLNRIYHPDNVFAIHFDLKVSKEVIDTVKGNILTRYDDHSNIIFLKSELITYRGVSMLLNTINAMQRLLEHEKHWDYFINLSGSDYPLVAPILQRKLLGMVLDKEYNFVTYTGREKWKENIEYRFRNFYVDEALSFTSKPDTRVRQLPTVNTLVDQLEIQYTNAEAWMVNSRDFCNFVVSSAYARKLLLTFAFSVESSEHYFSTLIWNHPKYNRTIAKHGLHAVLWYFKGEKASQHPFNVDEQLPDGSYKYLEAVLDAPSFFMRKFKVSNSPLMDIVDKRSVSAEQVRRTSNHFKWLIRSAIDEHQAKPPLTVPDD